MTSSRPAPRGHFKGAVLREIGPWLHRRFGVQMVRRAFESLPADLQAGLELDPQLPSLGALASSWYDTRIYQHVFDQLLEGQAAQAQPALAHEAARTVLEHTLRGIYAQLFRLMATPPLYARYVQKIWDMHYDTGTVTVESLSATKALHRVHGWTGHHPFACLINRQSGIVVYSMMGLPQVQIEQERCSWPVCEATYSWKA